MSNYTTFFPSATGGGSTEITDPDKINKLTIGTNQPTELLYNFYCLQQNGTVRAASDNNNGLLGTSTAFRFPGGGPVTQTSDNTEITLANVTNGSGYLCNIITPLGALGATQTIKITIDGGTEKVYTYDYDKGGAATNYDDIYARLLWGTCEWGSWSNKNTPDNTDAVGLGGLAGMPYTYNDFTFPPINEAPLSTYGNLRIYSPSVFKNYNLPKLRFESSLLVKCTTSALYETGTYNARGAATYYLDSQL